ncbi:MAG: NAD(P)/FAD-dependent oxidoreductase [Myxococcota bacterium]
MDDEAIPERQRPLASRYDAVIVGARCAGAATAMLLARRGLRVLAVDKSPFGADTLSTHALMRGGVLQLHRWGLLDAVREAGTPPVRTTSFHYGEETVAIPIEPRRGVDALYAPRRTVLDPVLVAAARKAGAEVRHGVRLAGLVRNPGGRVCGAVVEDATGVTTEIGAGIVIGADGLRSRVARLVGARAYRVGRHASALVYGYWSNLDRSGYHWYYRPGASAGFIPTGDGLACVFAAAPSRRFRRELRTDVPAAYHRVLADASLELARDLRRGTPVGGLRGFGGQVGFFRSARGAGWALVGDAGYFKDPLTAHGMTDALRDAELLARAVARGTEDALVEYEATRDALSQDLFEATDAIASFNWDLEEVRGHHIALSKSMRRETAALWSLDGESPMAA